jgi:hypothetical protein
MSEYTTGNPGDVFTKDIAQRTSSTQLINGIINYLINTSLSTGRENNRAKTMPLIQHYKILADIASRYSKTTYLTKNSPNQSLPFIPITCTLTLTDQCQHLGTRGRRSQVLIAVF